MKEPIAPMEVERDIPFPRQCLHAFLIATALVSLIAACTNSMRPQWDGLHYVDMADSGIIGNPNLVAPFAYRLGMPILARLLATLLGVSTEDGFRIVGWIAALALLMSIFTLARLFTTDYRQAIIAMILLGLSFVHLKFPLFFYSMVDIAAYPFMVFAFWALITNRCLLCLLLSSIGLLFKEFLVVPLILLLLDLGYEFSRTKSKRTLWQLCAAIGVGAIVILLPRLCIPISKATQLVDPLNDLSTLRNLWRTPLNGRRILNIAYAMVSYWLPTLLLLTRARLNVLWADLRRLNMRAICGIYLFLVLLATMYGGTNIYIFVSYSVAVQAVVLALLFRHGVGVAEMIYVLLATLLYNKILLDIPTPDVDFDADLDFYGGWSSRVNTATLMRLLECGAFVAIGVLIRMVVGKISSDGHCGDATASELPSPAFQERGRG